MAGVLLVLCLAFGLATIEERAPDSPEAAAQLATGIPAGKSVLLASGQGQAGTTFVDQLSLLSAKGALKITGTARTPAEAKALLDPAPDVILCSPAAAGWSVFDPVRDRVRSPRIGTYSVFLSPANLLNIANQVAVIAILAVGMTMVIIARGIDLSVGSLIALSSVVTTWLIAEKLGGTGASSTSLLLAGAAGIATGAVCGAFSGWVADRWRVPSFIVTLALMQMASGAAYKLANGQSINALPPEFNWLGLQATLGLPHSVWLALGVAVAAHVFMTQSVMGRHIYAVGGSPEAARCSGISLTKVRLAVFTTCGALAGLGGVTVASQFTNGSPTYGQWAELDAIAAAVVGGASLDGGRGTIFGTVIGALIIAVIRNGMNLLGVDPYLQKIWLGLVILAAVLLDRLVRRGSADGVAA